MNFIEYLFAGKENTDTPALCGSFGELTFNELYQKVITGSGWIQETYGSNHNIILISDNSSFFVITYFSVIHSGNRIVLVDPVTSLSEIHAINSIYKPVVVFSDCKPDEQNPFNCPIYGPDHLNLPVRAGSAPAQGKDHDCAVIIYTSGSTGSKKGVMLSHANLIANTSSIIEYLKITEKDRICVVLPFFYCYGASLLHTHIRAGGSVVLARSIFLGSVIRTINEYQCTGFAGVPSTYLILAKKTPFLSSSFPTLRTFQQAGGHLSPEIIREFVTSFPDKEFFVMYGATEATARLSSLPPCEVLKRPGSIGKGIPGVDLKVVDMDGNPVSAGEIGEIIAKGDNIMVGYYQDPEGTNAVIRDGWYHTGDLGTIDEDGFIYVTGRKGSFIKSAGFKVSPGEIEDIILGVPEVDACLVIGLPHPIMGEAIVACVQSANANDPLRETLIDQCRQKLPTHKVPVDIVFLDEIPLNSSGKPDRQKTVQIVQEIHPEFQEKV